MKVIFKHMSTIENYKNSVYLFTKVSVLLIKSFEILLIIKNQKML